MVGSPEFESKGLIDNKSISICSSNVLAPDWQQAITETNIVENLWHHVASQRHKESNNKPSSESAMTNIYYQGSKLRGAEDQNAP